MSSEYLKNKDSLYKWWVSVLIGVLFLILSSPLAYYVTSTLTTKLGARATSDGPGPNYAGVLFHAIIFTLIVRLILW